MLVTIDIMFVDFLGFSVMSGELDAFEYQFPFRITRTFPIPNIYGLDGNLVIVWQKRELIVLLLSSLDLSDLHSHGESLEYWE